MNLIIYRLNDGLVDLLFQTNSNVLKNHLIFSYAFGEFYDRYKTERGRVYIANTRLKKSSIIGFNTGVIYWIFTKEFVNFYFKKIIITNFLFIKFKSVFYIKFEPFLVKL